MRLTLRTLLAYLDDVLDPADKEELAQKIQSSDFAEDLVHKTRDTVRRLRLSAPQVIGTGMGLDPNSVSEYLDNVMPPDAVGDFERICLESDVHLAEAAACHHVLTMVLGQPADVDPIARQRMYTIATEAVERKKLRIEPAHTPMAAATAATVATPGQPMRLAEVTPAPRVEIPEYLRAGSFWKSWGLVAGLTAILLVGIGILLATGMQGWVGKKSPVASLTPESAQATETETPSAPPTEPAPPNVASQPTEGMAAPPAAPTPGLGAPPQPLTPSTPPPSAEPVATQPVVTQPATTLPVATQQVAAPPVATPPGVTKPAEPADRYPTSDIGPALSAGAPTGSAAPPALAPASIPPVAAPSNSVPVPVATNSPPENPKAVAASDNATPPPAVAGPGRLGPTEPAANVPQAGAVAAAGTAIPDAGALAVNAAPESPANIGADGNPVAKPRAAGPAELGTYIGGKTVLLRYDDKIGAWFRIEPRAAIVAGEKILALPEFRPKVALLSGLHLDMSGGTVVLVEGDGNAPQADAEAAAAAPGIPMLDLVYGRIVLANSTDTEKRVRLKLGSSAGEATIGRNSTLAVEVERRHVPGADPRNEPAPVECRMYAPEPNGGVVWKDMAGTKMAEKASRWTVAATGATEMAADTAPPEWIYHEPIVQLSEQRYGAPRIESKLVSNQPADVQLLELFQTPKLQKEVKSLVARTSIHVGMFEPFVKALGDPEQKPNWKTHIDALRAAMALSPESANKVWQTLVDQRGKPAAGDLFEMLCGYNADAIGHTPEQIKSGAIARLIDRLEDNSLDYRVLAVQDLADITGKRLMSNPAATQAERTLAIRKWRARLDAGDVKAPTAQ